MRGIPYSQLTNKLDLPKLSIRVENFSVYKSGSHYAIVTSMMEASENTDFFSNPHQSIGFRQKMLSPSLALSCASGPLRLVLLLICTCWGCLIDFTDQEPGTESYSQESLRCW